MFKNKNYEEELDRLSLENDRAHQKIKNLIDRVEILEEILENYEESKKTIENFLYTIRENNIVSSYEDPEYLIKHINKCLDRQEPFTLNEMAKNYWLSTLEEPEQFRHRVNEAPVNLKYGIGAKAEEKNTNSTYQWR